MEGNSLRLKQQYTLCSASLQDIIARFESRSGNLVNWEEFPEKVAVQMNDTHPTLCIPELIRLLVDGKGLGWKEAWSITQRYFSMFMLIIEWCQTNSWLLISLVHLHDPISNWCIQNQLLPRSRDFLFLLFCASKVQSFWVLYIQKSTCL